MKSFEGCPHYTSEDREDQDESAANEGTFLHAVCENYGNLVSNSGKKAFNEGAFLKAWADAQKSDDAFDFDSEDEPEAQTVARLACTHLHPLVAPNDGRKTIFEGRMNAAGLTWGTMDVGVVHSGGLTATTRDWKFGRIAVDPPENNLQAWAYTLGMFTAYPDLISVEFAFYQPRVDHDIQPYTFHRDQIPMLVDRISRVIARASQSREKTDEVRNHNVGQTCEYCGLLDTCPAFKSKVKVKALRDVDWDDKHELMEWPDSLGTETERGAARFLVGLLEKHVNRTKDQLNEMAIDGLDAEGYKLVQVSGKKTVPATNRQSAFETAIAEACGEAGPDLIEAVRLSMGAGQYKKFASALDMTLSKLSGPVMAALMKKDLVKVADDYAYLRRKTQ